MIGFKEKRIERSYVEKSHRGRERHHALVNREHVKVPGSLRLQVTQASFNEIVERDVRIMIIGLNTYECEKL
jgi:hypothetical protein